MSALSGMNFDILLLIESSSELPKNNNPPSSKQESALSRGVKVISEKVEGVEAIVEVAENSFALGEWGCSLLGYTGSEAVLGRLGHECAGVGRVLGLFDWLNCFKEEEEEADPTLKSLNAGENTLNWLGMAADPILFMEAVGLFTLGVVSTVIGWLQIVVFLGADVTALVKSSYELSQARSKEEELSNTLDQATEENLEEEGMSTNEQQKVKLEELQNEGKQKVLSLIQRILDVVATILGIVAVFAVETVLIPIIAVLGVSSGAIALWTLYAQKEKTDETSSFDSAIPAKN